MGVISAMAGAYDFTAKVSSGQTLYFKVINESAKTVAVVNQTGGHSIWGFVSDAYTNESDKPTGNLVIPAQITYGSKTYKITTIDTLAFRLCTGLKSVTISEGITSINAGAFEDCYSITKAVLPTTLSNLECQAFRDCNQLALADISKTKISVLSEYVFLSTSIKELRLPETVTTIDGNAVYDISTLEYIYMGSNITYIATAFQDLPNLKAIYMATATPPSIGSYYFSSSITSNVPLYVPEASISAYKSKFIWQEFASILPYNTSGGDTYYGVQVSINDTEKGTLSINGTKISSTAAKVVVKKGDNVSIVVLPTEAYTLKKLIVNNVDVTSQIKNNVYSAGAISADMSVSAEFEIRHYTVTIGIYGSAANIVLTQDYGTPLSLDFNSLTSDPIKSVTINGEKYLGTSYTTTKLGKNLTINITPANLVRQDVNADTKVNAADVVAIYNYIINGK